MKNTSFQQELPVLTLRSQSILFLHPTANNTARATNILHLDDWAVSPLLIFTLSGAQDEIQSFPRASG